MSPSQEPSEISDSDNQQSENEDSEETDYSNPVIDPSDDSRIKHHQHPKLSAYHVCQVCDPVTKKVEHYHHHPSGERGSTRRIPCLLKVNKLCENCKLWLVAKNSGSNIQKRCQHEND